MRYRVPLMAAAAATLIFTGPVSAKGPGGHRGDRPDGPPPPPPGETDRGGDRDGMRPPGAHRGLGAFWNNERIVEALGLTLEQIVALDASLAETKECLEAQKENIGEANALLHETLLGDESEGYRGAVLDALAAVQLAKASAEICTVDHKIAVQLILDDAQEEILASLGRPDRPPVGDGDDSGKTLGPGDGPGDGDREPERRARLVIEGLMPMIHRALADCVFDDVEQEMLAEVYARLSPEVLAIVQPIIESRIEEILSNCDPADISAAVEEAVTGLTALIDTLADDDGGLTCQDVFAVHRALRELPRRVRFLAAPQVLDYLRQVIEEQGGISDCRDRLPEGALAAYREIVQMIRDAACDEDGLTTEEADEIRAAIENLSPELEAAIGPRLLEIIERVLARQDDGATEEDKAYEIPEDINKPQPRSRHGADRTPDTVGNQIQDRDRDRLSQ